MSVSLLLLGFVFGMRHALEADHIAAVAYFANRTTSLRQAARHGAVWGLGHTAALFLFGAVVLLVDGIVPARFAAMLELAVALMLILLGIDLFRRLLRERVHFHLHSHGQKVYHFHAHSHIGEGEHNCSTHQHEHATGFPKGALLVGLMHGMAGSAALIILTLQTVSSVWTGLLYIAIFGLGSVVGMTALSFIIAVPLKYSEKGVTGLYNVMQALIALATLSLGMWMAIEHTYELIAL